MINSEERIVYKILKRESRQVVSFLVFLRQNQNYIINAYFRLKDEETSMIR
jgi:hypothetical protein